MATENFNIELSFAKSRSSTFKKVLDACGKFSGFYIEEGIYKLPLTLGEIFTKWDHFCLVFHSASKWASFDVVFKERLIVDYKEKRKVFYNLQELRYCFKGRLESFFPEGYCKEADWGCHLLGSVKKLPSLYSSTVWYGFGSLVNGKWIVDKHKLRTILLNEARLKMIDSCPAFNRDYLIHAVDSLPSEIDINNRCWEIETTIDFVDGVFKEIPVGLKWTGETDISILGSFFAPADFREIDINSMTEQEVSLFLKNFLKQSDEEQEF